MGIGFGDPLSGIKGHIWALGIGYMSSKVRGQRVSIQGSYWDVQGREIAGNFPIGICIYIYNRIIYVTWGGFFGLKDFYMVFLRWYLGPHYGLMFFR